MGLLLFWSYKRCRGRTQNWIRSHAKLAKVAMNQQYLHNYYKEHREYILLHIIVPLYIYECVHNDPCLGCIT